MGWKDFQLPKMSSLDAHNNYVTESGGFKLEVLGLLRLKILKIGPVFVICAYQKELSNSSTLKGRI